MKAIIILAILFAIGLIVLFYKRESDTQKMLFSLFILASIIGLAVVGNVMRSLLPLFLAHIVALVFSYGALLYYIFRDRTQWIWWLLPVGTLALYVFFAWVGNEHLTGLG
jgi:NADH:ubiquinone oxidoreductase subunit K